MALRDLRALLDQQIHAQLFTIIGDSGGLDCNMGVRLCLRELQSGAWQNKPRGKKRSEHLFTVDQDTGAINTTRTKLRESLRADDMNLNKGVASPARE